MGYPHGFGGVWPWFLWGITLNGAPLPWSTRPGPPANRRRPTILLGRLHALPCAGGKPGLLSESQQAARVLDKDLVDEFLVESLITHQLLDRLGYVLPAVPAVLALPVLQGEIA